MSTTAFFLIFLSVILHASFHAMSKSCHPTYAFYLIASFLCGLLMSSLLPISGLVLWRMPTTAAVCVLIGGSFGALGNMGYSRAYRNADISLAYPLARSLPVLATALFSSLFGMGKPLAVAAIAGMGIVFCGCMIMPIRDWRHLRGADFCNRGMGGVLLAACATTGYTLADSVGVRSLIGAAGGTPGLDFMAAVAYAGQRELIICAGMGIAMLFNRAEQSQFDRGLFKRRRLYLTVVFSCFSYVLVLLAMNFVTNVSFVQAFRQLSLPAGVLLGWLFLKEKVTGEQLFGLSLILCGLFLSILG